MSQRLERDWDIPIRGFEVQQITFAYPLDIVVYGDAGVTALIRFEGSFQFSEAGQERRSLDASSERWEDLTAVLRLRHDRVKYARATESGELAVEFESGSLLEAGWTEMYESWQVLGSELQLIALPGGGVAVFRDNGGKDQI